MTTAAEQPQRAFSIGVAIDMIPDALSPAQRLAVPARPLFPFAHNRAKLGAGGVTCLLPRSDCDKRGRKTGAFHANVAAAAANPGCTMDLLHHGFMLSSFKHAYVAAHIACSAHLACPRKSSSSLTAGRSCYSSCSVGGKQGGKL